MVITINSLVIKAIMPIKLNNERLPGKNTMLLGDKPLLQYELLNLLEIDSIDDIFVYCSDSILTEYLPDGVKFKKRNAELDLPTANFTQIFSNFIKEEPADIYIYAHATAPFISVETMKSCLSAVISETYDSAFCAVKIQDFLWKNNEPLNFDAANIPRSQAIEPIYRETSGVYVFTSEVFEKYRRRIGINPYIHEVTFKESIDINTKEDFELAKIMLNKDL